MRGKEVLVAGLEEGGLVGGWRAQAIEMVG